MKIDKKKIKISLGVKRMTPPRWKFRNLVVINYFRKIFFSSIFLFFFFFVFCSKVFSASPSPDASATTSPSSSPVPSPSPIVKIISVEPADNIVKGDEFEINFSVENAITGVEYYAKFGLDIETSWKGKTLNNGDWFSANSSWSNFPKFKDDTGKISGSLTVMTSDSTVEGANNINVRIVKIDKTTEHFDSFDSTPQKINIIAPPSPSPSPSPSQDPSPSLSPSPLPVPSSKPASPLPKVLAKISPSPKSSSSPSGFPSSSPSVSPSPSSSAQVLGTQEEKQNFFGKIFSSPIFIPVVLIAVGIGFMAVAFAPLALNKLKENGILNR